MKRHVIFFVLFIFTSALRAQTFTSDSGVLKLPNKETLEIFTKDRVEALKHAHIPRKENVRQPENVDFMILLVQNPGNTRKSKQLLFQRQKDGSWKLIPIHTADGAPGGW